MPPPESFLGEKQPQTGPLLIGKQLQLLPRAPAPSFLWSGTWGGRPEAPRALQPHCHQDALGLTPSTDCPFVLYPSPWHPQAHACDVGTPGEMGCQGRPAGLDLGLSAQHQTSSSPEEGWGQEVTARPGGSGLAWGCCPQRGGQRGSSPAASGLWEGEILDKLNSGENPGTSFQTGKDLSWQIAPQKWSSAFCPLFRPRSWDKS